MFIKSGEIRVPSILVSILLLICTLQSLFTGLTLDNIIKNSRQNFEMRLIDCERELKNGRK